MTTFRLEAIRARHGDALLLHAGEDLIMIDGGYSEVYRPFVKPRLAKLQKDRAAQSSRPDRPLDIRLLIVSHVDNDHILGLLEMTDELITAKRERQPPVVKIRQMWLNSFADEIAAEPDAAGVRTSGLEVASAGQRVARLGDDDQEVRDRLQPDTRLVLASVARGRQLREHAMVNLGIRMNRPFGGKAVLRQPPGEGYRVGDCELRVVGPGRKELDRLKRRWRRDVQKILEKERDRAAALEAAARLDYSVFNLSSIVVVAKSGERTMLLTGDARGDMILEWLEESKLLAAGGKTHFNLLKLPHHGSERNVTPEFFARVTADHYVISGDGKHGNPDPATLRMLLAARGAAEKFEIHLTYGPDELAAHPEFDGPGLDAVLDAHPGSRDRLRYPRRARQLSIHVDL